jgi:hypothetical protein
MFDGSADRNRGQGIRLLALLALLAWAGTAAGQAPPRADLKIAPAPYYVGVPIDLHLQVEGLQREPEPRCSAAPVDGGVISLVGVAPSVTTQVTIINGKTTRTESVTFVCRFSLTLSRPGTIRLGPFQAIQGAVEAKTPVYSIPVETIAPDRRVRIRLILPDKPVFVGQRLEVGIEWWLAEELQDRIQNYEIRSRLFETPDTFRFVEDRPPNRGEQTLSIQTEAGEKTLAAEVESRSDLGRPFLVVRSLRTLIPLHPGEFALGSATVSLKEVTRWQRDFFGGRRPAATRRIFGRDAERSLVVREAPRENRPASFGGAIGRGFSFDVAADRSVVRRGDPIVLTFTVRGEGGLENVGLPALESADALPRDSFSLAGDRPPGEIVDGAKIFRVPVRILDESLDEIPALPYSWFDPELGEYQTVYSRPIALSVRPAQLISAADVVAAQSGESEPAPSLEVPARARPAGAGRRAFSLTGANLAIELDRSRLLQDEESHGLRLGVTYGASILLLAASFAYRRRRDRDPEMLRIRASYKEQVRRIEAAASLPRKDALGEIASALRELAALKPGSSDPAREALIADCDAVFYSPDSEARAPVEGQLVERARSLAAEFGAELPRSGP